MINNISFKIFLFFIEIIDYRNKQKVINFFKKKFSINPLTVIDIGAHKGETIKLILNNFNLKKMISFEPNQFLYKKLIYDYSNENKIEILNLGVGEKNEIRKLNITIDSSSSTFNKINRDSKYFLRKEKILKYFSKNKNFIEKKQKIEIETLSNIIKKKEFCNIDILKIDTEGFELSVLKGINKQDFKKIKFIYFEHHFDLMIEKNYKFSDIDNLLKLNNFFPVLKIKMNFRKSFEYIYENKEKNFS